jgi:hypothetical protein
MHDEQVRLDKQGSAHCSATKAQPLRHESKAPFEPPGMHELVDAHQPHPGTSVQLPHDWKLEHGSPKQTKQKKKNNF